jgi:uncharacterized DUF497 family protein
MRFEFDPAKSEANKRKHGIDFVEAQVIWSNGTGISGPAKDVEDEERRMALGLIDGKVWAVVYTMRGETVRLISARRAKRKERRAYESQRVR